MTVGALDDREGEAMTAPLAAHVGWLLWCLDQGYKAAGDRAILSNWLLEDDATLADEELAEKAYLLDAAGEVIFLFGDPLATLRAEVERAFLGLVDRPRSDDYLRGVGELYGSVLDLIDKQREGQ